MPQSLTVSAFLIRRLNVQLTMALQSSGLVRIEPYQCSDDNLRLWTSIAKTQAVMAQTYLAQNRTGNLPALLTGLFQRSGWIVNTLGERTEIAR